ncbi:uncharacterized protein DNG_08315 [Cephalotrichum gorgonifer]|uniref:Chromo domain-containing protein n=1 Tax=Cephalotrichum gorgonifer TaxID=2041049 RepID=A0AAE8N5E4_9PEZI|nr:uncharacterized protein DNG_08315 [Cephalotrichum gorgonifer]
MIPVDQPQAAAGNQREDVDSDTTIDEASEEDMLWTVEDVLAEVPGGEDGQSKYYLISWSGFDLHAATWEPEEHLESPTIKSWEDTKGAIERGEKEEFDVSRWWEAKIQHIRDRLARANERDARRKSRGLPLTGTAATIEESLSDVLSEQAEWYAGQDPEPPLDGDEVDDAYLPPPSASGLSSDPPLLNRRVQTRADTHPRPRKTTSGQNATLTGRRSSVDTPASTQQRPKKLAQQASGPKGQDALSKTSPTVANMPQPQRPMQPTIPKPKPNPLKAKRSATTTGTQGAGANIFTSGKDARKRRNLAELMGDTAREKKLFQKHRITRIANLRSRDKEDLPPATPPSKLFEISKGGAGHGPKEFEAAKRATLETRQRKSPLTLGLIRRGTDDGGIDEEGGPPSQTEKKRRKKSVRFCDTPIMRSPSPIAASFPQSTPMDLDDPDEPSLFVPPGPPSPPKLEPPGDDVAPSLLHIPVSEKPEPNQSIAINKVICFGPGDSKKLQVSLDGVPSSPDEPWFMDLMGAEEINFTHMCAARNLAFQIRYIAGEKIGVGCVRSIAASEDLANVASRLKLGSFGAVCFRDGYFIVVCPSRCTDWKEGDFGIGAVTSPSEVDLRYLMFKRGPDGNPLPDQSQNLGQPGDELLGDRGIVCQQVLGFNFRSLLPANIGPDPAKNKHAFFLVFPPSREAELNALCLYLRSCDRQCRIYTNREPGSWNAILDDTLLCTIIFHEAATWALRKLRSVSTLISVGDHRATFWRFTEAMTAHSTIPLGEADRWTPPGQIGLHRLLPGGKAFLLTPSFLLTQPRQAAQFLTWYSERYDRTRHTRTYKIVVARGVCDFLRDVADQRWIGRKSIGLPAGKPGSGDEPRGRALDDCEALEVTWTILRHLVGVSTRDCSWRDEDLAPIVFAQDSLRPDDEQSLVNWLGWWSMNNLDRYRKFIVFGTDEEDMENGAIATVVTSFPTYHPDTTTDPYGCAATADIIQNAPNHPETVFTCRKLSNDDPGAILSYLESLTRMYPPSKTIAIIYKFPVGYSGDESFGEYNHYRGRFETFQSWFQYLRPFDRLSIGVKLPPNVKFVYGGFFYTIADEPGGGFPGPQHDQIRRHPWVAFYRPARPHLLTKGKYDGNFELLIWDWTARRKFPTEDQIPAEKLAKAQQQLIEFINQNTAAKNPGSVLENVWFGGPRSTTLDSHPMDATLEFLKDALEDTRAALPATLEQLISANYRKVIPQSQSQPQEREAPDSEMMEGEGVAYSDIFHPPRGNRFTQPSKCQNLLFVQAREALRNRRSDKQETFPYRFEPTTSWYALQKEEGRGFEHMFVGRWKAAFNELRINRGEENGGGAGSPDSAS